MTKRLMKEEIEEIANRYLTTWDCCDWDVAIGDIMSLLSLIESLEEEIEELKKLRELSIQKDYERFQRKINNFFEDLK